MKSIMALDQGPVRAYEFDSYVIMRDNYSIEIQNTVS